MNTLILGVIIIFISMILLALSEWRKAGGGYDLLIRSISLLPLLLILSIIICFGLYSTNTWMILDKGNRETKILKEEIKNEEEKINYIYNQINSNKKDNEIDSLKLNLTTTYADYQKDVKKYNSWVKTYNKTIDDKLNFFKKGKKKEITTEKMEKKIKEVL